MLSLIVISLLAQKIKYGTNFLKNIEENAKILNHKNQVLRKSTPASSHESINANHRQI